MHPRSCRPTIGNERLHQYSNDNGVRIVNFATSKNLVVKSTMFPHRNIHKYSWNACYYSVHNLLSSSVLSQTLKIKIYRTIILPVVLYGCENWLLTLREERRLRVFENRVLRRVFGPKRDEVTGNGENYIMRSLGIFTPYPILCGW